MSYCVNCGVELDATRASCPLCNTKVYNPNQPVDVLSPTPYPKQRGETEAVDSRQLTALVTIVLGTISVVCGLLNWLVFDWNYWSVYVIGVCVLLWVALIPVFFRDKVNGYACIALDGLFVILFVGVISRLHPGNGWYMEIAVPIILSATALLEIFYQFNIRNKLSLLPRAALMFAMVAALTVVVQVVISFHFDRVIVLSWSAVVLACCAAIDIILLAIGLHDGAREELRKRMHF